MSHKFPVRLKPGQRLEVTPLFGGRARVIITDGRDIDDFW